MKTLEVDLIEFLKTENRKLVIVEAGCGDALSGALLRTPGASKVLESVFIPYSKETQDFMSKDIWGANDTIIPGTRAVSLENLKRLAKLGFQHTPEINQPLSVYAATFQITDIVHGWMGKFTDTDMTAVHITIPIEGSSDNREQILEIIKKVAIQFIIDPMRSGSRYVYVDNYVSMYKEPGRNSIAKHKENEHEEFLNIWLNSLQDCETILFKKDHTIGRSIDLDREAQAENRNIVLYRGSFNPLSAAHIKIATQKNAVLVIGANTYDKGSSNVHDILHRVKACNDAGFDVLLCKHALFFDFVENLRAFNFKSKIEFVVGSDTMRRIMEASGVIGVGTDPIENVDLSVPYKQFISEATTEFKNKVVAVLEPFETLDVCFTVITRKNRGGKSYEYYLPIEHSTVTYLEIDTDFPSSTELRASRKLEDCNFATNAFDAYFASTREKPFAQFVEEYHAETDSRKYD